MENLANSTTTYGVKKYFLSRPYLPCELHLGDVKNPAPFYNLNKGQGPIGKYCRDYDKEKTQL